MGLTLSSGASVEPITTAEAKSQIRVDTSDDDTLIDNYIVAAREHGEQMTRRAFITQTWVWKLDKFPPGGVMYVPLPPLQSVTSIQYVDANGSTQTWSTDDYDVDISSKPGRIVPVYNGSFPTTRIDTNAVTVTFVAGYGDATTDVPEQLRVAISQLVGHWYEHREEVVTGTIVAKLPNVVETLFNLYSLPEAQ